MVPLGLAVLFVLCQANSDVDLYNEILESKIKKQQEQILQLQIQNGQLTSAIYRLEREMKDLKDEKAVKTTNNKRLLLDDPSHLQFEIDQLKSTISTLTSSMSVLTSSKGGAIYVRWGKSTCPTNGTEMVYTGYAGGSHYLNTGGAAEYVCLPKDPIIGKQVSIPYFGYMYGAEYETNYFGQPWQEDVPCAVCRSTINTNSVMIPARNQCFSDWKMEYHGHLASGKHDHPAASQFVCVDGHPESVVGGDTDENGKLFYPVIAECGSLLCPPYHNNTQLLCVVCSK